MLNIVYRRGSVTLPRSALEKEEKKVGVDGGRYGQLGVFVGVVISNSFFSIVVHFSGLVLRQGRRVLSSLALFLPEVVDQVTMVDGSGWSRQLAWEKLMEEHNEKLREWEAGKKKGGKPKQPTQSGSNPICLFSKKALEGAGLKTDERDGVGTSVVVLVVV